MKYICEESLTNFHFWGGAVSRVESLTYRQLEQLDDLLPATMDWDDFNLPTDTAINDLFWFEEDFIAQLLGFDSFEELERHNNGDDENDDDDENEEEE